MYRFTTISGAVLATLMLVAATAGTGHAAFDKAELKCRKGLAKNFTKAVSTAHKVLAGCHKGRNSGKIGAGTDCNDLATVDAAKGKFGKAKDKISGHVTKSCIDAGIDDAIIENRYISCSDDCTASETLPNPLTTLAELGTCLGCYAGELGEDLATATFGNPAAPMASKDDQKCHQGIGKNYGKLLKTIMKERTKCQDSEEKDGAMTLEETGCPASDLKMKISGGTTKAAEGMTKSCAAATLSNLDSCSDVDVPSLSACLAAETNITGDLAMPAGYELPPTVCPVQVNSTILAGLTEALGPGLTATDTSIELGWKGIAHLGNITDAYIAGVDVTCPGPGPGSCGSCTIDGLSPSAPGYADFTRCSNDLTIGCTMPFMADPACGGAECLYLLGAPLPFSSGNNPVCVLNYVSSDLTGTVDPDTGSQVLNIDLRPRVFLGADLSQPCPVCGGTCTAPLSSAGDPCFVDRDCNDPIGTANGVCGNYDSVRGDGVKEGTCFNGANDGTPCDITGVEVGFAGPPAGTSFDCKLDPLKNISGTGLQLPFELTTGSTSLAAENSCDAPLGVLNCFCGVCSGDTSLPCVNDAECAGAGAGTCTAIGSGEPRQPDDCSPVLTCTTALGNDRYECASGPDDTFCDAQVTAYGHAYIGCTTNADCGTNNVSCGDGGAGACGNCTATRRRPCFVDPIVATGTPDVDNPTVVSTVCVPPTNNSAINGVTGSPGPARFTIEMLSEHLY